MWILDHVNHDVVTLLMAVVLGGCIGFEREVSSKVAGLRTNILICVGATLFTMASKKFGNDPARIAAQIVSGIGFIGAGSIMRDGEHVTGLTTAATIWIVAAIGMALGFHEHVLACAVTVIVLFVQLAFTPLDAIINDWQERHTFRVLSKLEPDGIAAINGIFEKSKLLVLRKKFMKKSDYYISEWTTSGGRKKQELVMSQLMQCEHVVEVTY
jgi:putative Mg2+ transporter-C (MgtC) family protein